MLSVLTYMGIAVRDCVAYQLAGSQRTNAAEKAVALDPSNADYRNTLGKYLMSSEQRADLAIPQYNSAVSLNPHIAEYWLNLANAYGFTGARDQQKRALKRALDVEPNTPSVSREVGNALFLRGDMERAFEIFSVLLRSDPSNMEGTLQTCWQATDHDVDTMSDGLPLTTDAHLAFLRLLIGEGNSGGAEKVWSRLVALHKPFDPQLAAPYLEYLIARHRVDRARAAWNDLLRIEPGFRPYGPTSANIIVNGGFEEKLLNMGFDWRYEEHPHITLDTDEERIHGGRRSLSLGFDGGGVVDAGVSQLVPVDRHTRYVFSAYAKADNIFAAAGPQFVIQDAYTKKSLLVTKEILGTTDWTNVRESFTTGPNTELARLTIMRTLGAGPIIGRLWIDDVVLTRE